jgi:NADP-reducing hydrogenase subunit HndB
MGKTTLEGLRALRDEQRRKMSDRELHGRDIQIIVGMGTCGIAAGAKETFDALAKILDESGLSARVSLRQAGCMGLCQNEPTVEIVTPDLPATIYGKVSASAAEEIFKGHILGKTLVNKYIFDRPATERPKA